MVASQIDIHRKYGGVVPELASREHLRSIVPVVREALERAGMALGRRGCCGGHLRPGLVGSLLVGVTYGKALALSLGKPLVGGESPRRPRPRRIAEAYRAGQQPKLPAVCLIVSGGHTVLYGVNCGAAETDAGGPAT